MFSKLQGLVSKKIIFNLVRPHQVVYQVVYQVIAFCRITNYDVLCWLVGVVSRDVQQNRPSRIVTHIIVRRVTTNHEQQQQLQRGDRGQLCPRILQPCPAAAVSSLPKCTISTDYNVTFVLSWPYSVISLCVPFWPWRLSLLWSFIKKTRKRAIAKALQLKGHSEFAPVYLAYYQHFLGFFVRKYTVLGSSAWQPQMQTCLLNVNKVRVATWCAFKGRGDTCSAMQITCATPLVNIK